MVSEGKGLQQHFTTMVIEGEGDLQQDLTTMRNEGVEPNLSQAQISDTIHT